ncbi:zf-HC2 domain-containing protein [Microtetraspora malaysiensis]|uniref:zf-HC2 domain-containing protein n=1 Tax=Microtetraspora malaysiensis TaxID=161358 RepID=UPI000A541010|nr:zf-HC2 domain-containing protein [Microtetraspora malaysiensis]
MSAGNRQTDAELLDAVRGGNVSAYAALFDRHVTAARALAGQMVEGDAEAEEILSETFAAVLNAIRSGSGPESAFRPYLLTALRRTAAGQRDEGELGAPYVDPAHMGPERSPVAAAYFSLPERWRMVLWHTEVETCAAAEIAPMLGLSVKGVAALAFRAREGLRQAFLQIHLAAGPLSGCRATVEKMGAYVRGGLSRRETRMVDGHVADCVGCRTVFLELSDLVQGLRVVVGPLIAGPFLTGYLAALNGAAEGGGPRAGGVWGRLRRVPPAYWAAAAGAAMAAAGGGLLLAGTVTGGRHPAAQGVHDRLDGSGVEGRSEPQPVPSPPARSPVSVPSAPSSLLPFTPGRSPAPSATGSARPRTAGGGSSSGAATPTPAAGRPTLTRKQAQAPVPRTARLAATVEPVGALVRDRRGIVAVRLRNTGNAASAEVEAAVDLPRGVAPAAAPAGKGRSTAALEASGGWACRTSGTGARCAHDGLAPGQATSIFLPVTVAGDAPRDRGPAVRVRAGTLRAAATSAKGVSASGATARFAADGHVTGQAAGGDLLACPSKTSGCAEKVLVDRDGDPSTRSSGSARLSLPSRARVLWAGLYWSAGREGSSPAGVVRVRAPRSARYVTVRATELTRRSFSPGTGYLAFADVTRLVRDAGPNGVWWVADPSIGIVAPASAKALRPSGSPSPRAAVPAVSPPASPKRAVPSPAASGTAASSSATPAPSRSGPAGRGAARAAGSAGRAAGSAGRAGWTLVVVASDPRQPYGQAAVLETASLLRGGRPLNVTLGGLGAGGREARLEVLSWPGKAGPRRNAVTLRGQSPVLTVLTRKDALLFGLAAISVPTLP